MIQITLKDNAMWARGHSGYAPKGQDILCAAVSILMEATADALERQDKLVLSYFGDGFCSILAAEAMPCSAARLSVSWVPLAASTT